MEVYAIEISFYKSLNFLELQPFKLEVVKSNSSIDWILLLV